jgi:hypothetical protein
LVDGRRSRERHADLSIGKLTKLYRRIMTAR